MNASFAQPLLNAGVADGIGRCVERQCHSPPISRRAALRSHEAVPSLFLLGLLVLPENAGQIAALPVVQCASGSDRFPGRLTGLPGREHGERVLRATAAPSIHHHAVGNPVDLGQHVRHLPQRFGRAPHPATYASAAFQITDFFRTDVQALSTPLAPQNGGRLFGAHARDTVQVRQGLSMVRFAEAGGSGPEG